MPNHAWPMGEALPSACQSVPEASPTVPEGLSPPGTPSSGRMNMMPQEHESFCLVMGGRAGTPAIGLAIVGVSCIICR